MNATDISKLAELLSLLKAHGVRSYDQDGVKLEFFCPKDALDAVSEARPGAFVVPDRLRGLNPAYFNPALGAVEIK